MANLRLVKAGKSYGNAEVIDDLNLEVEDGSFTVLVGPSGCGKSTLLRMIAGIEEISAGDLLIDGERMNDADPVRRGISMVFQNYALYPHMTVEANIGFGLKMARVPREESARRVREAAEILKISPLLKRKPGQLSGGQRQRVAIGRAIVREPKLFLFDEPLSNLDAELRVEMRVEIAKLHRSLGATMIYVTHDQTEAMTLADRIVVLRAGKIEQAGTPVELYDNPANQFVAGFIGSPKMNFLEGQVASVGAGTPGISLRCGPQIDLRPLEASDLIDQKVTVGIRPEHVVAPETARYQTDMTVDVVENLGGSYFVYGQLPGGETLVVERRGLTLPKIGEVIRVGFNDQDVRVFSADGRRIRTAIAN